MVLAGTTAEPTIRVSGGWTSRFTVLWFGFWMAWLVPVQLVLPNQFAALDSAHKVRDFGITNGAAGVVALLTAGAVAAGVGVGLVGSAIVAGSCYRRQVVGTPYGPAVRWVNYCY